MRLRPLLALLMGCLDLCAQELPTVTVCPLPGGGGEGRALLSPTSCEFALEIDFPWPVCDWAGRGFTPDPERFAGDFVVEAERGASRMYVTALAANAHRVLHVALTDADGSVRTFPLEFVPSVPGRALRKLTLTAEAPAAPLPSGSVPARVQPTARSSASSEIALLRLMRLAEALPAATFDSLLLGAPALHLVRRSDPPSDLGEVTVRIRYALSDDVTGEAGLAVEIANATGKRILLDPQSWTIAAGGHDYPIRTVDFVDVLPPRALVRAFLVLGPRPDGFAASLGAREPASLRVAICARASARPVSRYAVTPLLAR